VPPSSAVKKKPKKSSLQLWPEQQDVFQFTVERDATAMFCEQRTGKTYVTLKNVEHNVAWDIIRGVDFCGILVTLLTNRDSTWLDALAKFLPDVNVTSDWEVFKKLPAPRILLVHYEMLPKLINKLVKYKKFNWAAVDEAQRISNRGNKAARGMARLAWIERRLALTGTPQEVRETDYFGIFKFLDPDVFGTNWAKFEKHFMEWPKVDFENAPPGSALWQKKTLQQRILKNKAKFREDRREEFIDLLKPYCIRLTQEDVGIKKAKVHKVDVLMTKPQRDVYKDMLRDSFAYLPSRGRNKRSQRRVTAPLVITNIAKRRQIATGFVYDDDDRLHDLGDGKLRETVKLVERLPKPVVVFTAFRPDNDLVYETLVEEGYDVVQVNGSTKKKLRPQIWRDFQRAQYDVAVVQVKTGGTGVDLWKSSHAIVYSMTHSYRDWDQMKARLSAKGKLRPSEFYVLCSKNSIDEELYDLVIVKKFNTELTLKHLKRGTPSCPAKQPQKRPSRKLLKRKQQRTNPSTPSTILSKRPASSLRRSGSRSVNSASKRPSATSTAGTRRKTSTKS
jgi:SNF2 family DNA or RNA helicase